MKTVKVQLPDAAVAFVDDEVAKGGYDDAAAYLLSLVEQQRSAALREELEEMLIEADRSPSSPMTHADFEDLRRIGTEILARRKAK